MKDNIDLYEPIGQKLDFWLKKRGLTRELLEKHLAMRFEEIENAINESDTGIVFIVTQFLNILPAELQIGTTKPILPLDMGLSDWQQAQSAIRDLANNVVKKKFYPTWIVTMRDPANTGGVSTAGMLISELTRKY